MKRVLLFIFYFLLFAVAKAQLVTTIAGSAGLTGITNGIGTAARFNNPHGITSDKNGNVYITDRYNNLIRKINSSGNVTTFAGTGAPGSTDGPGNIATFYEPWAIASDAAGNLYVADTKNYKIRKIDVNGNVSTIAGAGVFGTTNGANNIARFGFSSGIAVTANGNTIYVCDYNTHVIRKIFNGEVTTLAGTIYIAGSTDGQGLAATFNHPFSIEIDNSGNLIVGDEWNNIIRKVSSSGLVSTFAGQGIIGSINSTALLSQFNYPWDIAIDTLDNIFILDGFNFTVRKISSSGVVNTYAGTPGLTGAVDGSGPAARFNNAAGITYNHADKCLYVADCNNQLIRKITPQSSITITLTVSSNSTVCSGDSIRFNAVPSGLTNYTIKEGSAIIGSSGNGTILIPSLSSGTHNLICTAYDSNGGLASSNNVTVTVLNAFTTAITSSNGTSICNGDSLMLTAQAAASYLWSNGNTTQNIYASSPGTVSVNVTNANGCKATASINITAATSPSATITSSAFTICPSDSAQLTASAGASWKWSNGATTQSIKIPAGTYSVTVSNISGCSARSTAITISNFAIVVPLINPPGPIAIIQGDSVLLTASGGSNYQWSNAATGTAVYIHASGNYFVQSLSNGCAVPSVTVSVNVISSSALISVTGVTSFCEGHNVLLTSAFTTGNQWYYNGLAINAANGQQYIATDSGYYKVGVIQGSGILYSDSILVTVFSSPQLADISDTSVCRNTRANLQVTPEADVDYGWYKTSSGGSALGIANNYQTQPVINNETYYIESIGNNGCISVARAAVNVRLLPSPLSDFTISLKPDNGDYITTFNNTSINADYYSWIFADTSLAGNISHDVNAIHTYNATGNYTVLLISQNRNGCSDTLSKIINVHSNNATFVPTTFTPNADGKNDIFRVRGDNFTMQEMKIYDQWGKLIYLTDASKPEWDGKVNGVNVQNATYVYKIKIADAVNNSTELTGSITVIK